MKCHEEAPQKSTACENNSFDTRKSFNHLIRALGEFSKLLDVNTSRSSGYCPKIEFCGNDEVENHIPAKDVASSLMPGCFCLV